jgi:hypothetical protein
MEFETQPADDASQTSKKPLLPSGQRLPDVVIPKVSKTGESKQAPCYDLSLSKL